LTVLRGIDPVAAHGPASHGPATRGLVRQALLTAAFYLGVVLFWASCLAWSVVSAILFRLLPRRIGAPLGRRMIMGGFRYYVATMHALGCFRLDLRALDALRDAGGLVIVCNHPSLLDAVIVISRLPRVVCIGKASLWDNWCLGGCMRLSGYIRNDTAVTLVKRATEALRDGQQLLIFPEGSRTAQPPLDRFKGGFALMAKAAGVPVQTVLIETRSRYLTKGWPLFRKPEMPLVMRARLGERFVVSGDVGAFSNELEGYFRRELAARA
jgi:1-acyl-sn-glycerol-3-phosphate acyltransferase